MTLSRYLLTLSAIHIAGFSLIIIVLGGPEPWDGSILKAYAMIPVASAAMALGYRHYANEVPEEQRTSFWSYRSANISLAIVWGVILFGLVTFAAST